MIQKGIRFDYLEDVTLLWFLFREKMELNQPFPPFILMAKQDANNKLIFSFAIGLN